MPAHLMTTRLLALPAAGALLAGPAFAHHPTGGLVPQTFAEGLLSGLGHPVIGLDHLAALVGVGLLSSRFARGLALPAVWIAFMAMGTGVHLAGIGLPFAEILVTLTVVAVGVAAAVRPTLALPAVVVLFAAGGLTHGHALAEAIVGARDEALAAYLVGLVAVQAALATAVTLAARRQGSLVAPSARLRMAGALVAAAGLGVFAAPVIA
jgi:urease accessory protein